MMTDQYGIEIISIQNTESLILISILFLLHPKPPRGTYLRYHTTRRHLHASTSIVQIEVGLSIVHHRPAKPGSRDVVAVRK